MTVRTVTSLVMNRPDFFEDEAFMAWLNNPNTVVMTWHRKGAAASEWSDTVVLVDPQLEGEGADADMPAHIWEQIVQACRDAGVTGEQEHIPVRLTNVG